MLDIRRLTLSAALAALLAPAGASASADLARSKNCVACHSAERRMIGPTYKAIAARYADDAGAVRTLTERILAGSSGNWGPMPMPPQPSLSRDDAETLARWILTHR